MKVGDIVRPDNGGYTEMRGLVMTVKPANVEIFWFNPRHGEPRFGWSSKEGLEVV